MSDQAAARPRCDHHWVSHFQPDIPKVIGWVSVCSQCGDINGAELSATLAKLAEPRHAPHGLSGGQRHAMGDCPPGCYAVTP